MTETHPTHNPAHDYPALYQLTTQMRLRGYTCQVDEHSLTVIAPVDHGPRLADVITVRPRAVDGGRPWFWTSWGRALAPLDSVDDAALQIVAMLKPSRLTRA